jgi:hypothetical protein
MCRESNVLGTKICQYIKCEQRLARLVIAEVIAVWHLATNNTCQ